MKNEGQVRFGCRIFLGSQESFGKIVERARFCEKYGFDSVLIDDHLLYGTDSAAAPEAFTTLAAVGLQTEKIRVGVAVTDLVRRHPAIVAQTTATLASMLPGRVFLGLGAGDPVNQTPFGLSSEKRFSKLKEGLKLMNLLWTSSIEKPATYKGRFFSL
ncbi:MAG TPA: LLM class flavin-dependent oxidoreductase, partial [Candidatus Bathyarchaeia archaeon]|nr:LLM class flavin-dependent oxidoreductase [Candidatus Bathyarchaeia archaeon]